MTAVGLPEGVAMRCTCLLVTMSLFMQNAAPLNTEAGTPQQQTLPLTCHGASLYYVGASAVEILNLQPNLVWGSG